MIFLQTLITKDVAHVISTIPISVYVIISYKLSRYAASYIFVMDVKMWKAYLTCAWCKILVYLNIGIITVRNVIVKKQRSWIINFQYQ